jgi:hypothetical protein
MTIRVADLAEWAWAHVNDELATPALMIAAATVHFPTLAERFCACDAETERPAFEATLLRGYTAIGNAAGLTHQAVKTAVLDAYPHADDGWQPDNATLKLVNAVMIHTIGFISAGEVAECDCDEPMLLNSGGHMDGIPVGVYDDAVLADQLVNPLYTGAVTAAECAAVDGIDTDDLDSDSSNDDSAPDESHDDGPDNGSDDADADADTDNDEDDDDDDDGDSDDSGDSDDDNGAANVSTEAEEDDVTSSEEDESDESAAEMAKPQSKKSRRSRPHSRKQGGGGKTSTKAMLSALLLRLGDNDDAEQAAIEHDEFTRSKTKKRKGRGRTGNRRYGSDSSSSGASDAELDMEARRQVRRSLAARGGIKGGFASVSAFDYDKQARLPSKQERRMKKGKLDFNISSLLAGDGASALRWQGATVTTAAADRDAPGLIGWQRGFAMLRGSFKLLFPAGGSRIDSYQRRIERMAADFRKSRPTGWYAYDVEYRRRASITFTHSGMAPDWDLDQEIFNTIFGACRAALCDICGDSTHISAKCPVIAAKHAPAGLREPPSGGAAKGAGSAPHAGVCRQYNKGTCTYPKCKFPHRCEKCGSDAHGANTCP